MLVKWFSCLQHNIMLLIKSCTSYMATLGTCIGYFTPPALPYGRTIVGGSSPGLVETLISNAIENHYRLCTGMYRLYTGM